MLAVKEQAPVVEEGDGHIQPAEPSQIAGGLVEQPHGDDAPATVAERDGHQDGRDGHAFMLAIDKIKFDDELMALFPPDEEVLARVMQGLKIEGYDSAAPVVVDDDNTLVDGHTRVEGSERAGRKDVLAVRKKFANTQVRREYAIRAQLARRNLDDAKMVSLIKLIDRPAQHGGARKKSGDSTEASPTGKSAEATAKKAGTSVAKVNKIRRLEKHPDLEALVAKKKMTLNAANEEARKREASPEDQRQHQLQEAGKHLQAAAGILRALGMEENAAEVEEVIGRLPKVAPALDGMAAGKTEEAA
jgi:hypothetical protein